MQKIFCYGTLKNGTIQLELLGRKLSGEIWYLPEHELTQIWADDDYYPAVRPRLGEKVYGRVYEVSLDELEKLDEYEGSAYERVHAFVFADSKTERAWCYKPIPQG